MPTDRTAYASQGLSGLSEQQRRLPPFPIQMIMIVDPPSSLRMAMGHELKRWDNSRYAGSMRACKSDLQSTDAGWLPALEKVITFVENRSPTTKGFPDARSVKEHPSRPPTPTTASESSELSERGTVYSSSLSRSSSPSSEGHTPATPRSPVRTPRRETPAVRERLAGVAAILSADKHT